MSEDVPERAVPDWAGPDWFDDAAVVAEGADTSPDGDTVDAGPGQPGPPAPEVVAARVRARRRGLVLGAVGVVLAYVAFVVVLSVIAKAWPTRYAWVLLAVVLVVAVGTLWPLRTPAGRAAWDERAALLVRTDAALHQHVSIGEDERDEVTAAARQRRQLAGPAWIGYPLLALLVVYLLFGSHAISLLVAWLGTLAVVVLCGLGLLRSHRRDAEAKRWLADPLPPVPPTTEPEPESEPAPASEAQSEPESPRA